MTAFAERFQRSGTRMNRLIGDLIDLASIEVGRLTVTREVADPTTREVADPTPIVGFRKRIVSGQGGKIGVAVE